MASNFFGLLSWLQIIFIIKLQLINSSHNSNRIDNNTIVNYNKYSLNNSILANPKNQTLSINKVTPLNSLNSLNSLSTFNTFNASNFPTQKRKLTSTNSECMGYKDCYNCTVKSNGECRWNFFECNVETNTNVM